MYCEDSEKSLCQLESGQPFLFILRDYHHVQTQGADHGVSTSSVVTIMNSGNRTDISTTSSVLTLAQQQVAQHLMPLPSHKLQGHLFGHYGYQSINM